MEPYFRVGQGLILEKKGMCPSLISRIQLKNKGPEAINRRNS